MSGFFMVLVCLFVRERYKFGKMSIRFARDRCGMLLETIVSFCFMVIGANKNAKCRFNSVCQSEIRPRMNGNTMGKVTMLNAPAIAIYLCDNLNFS